MGNDMLEVASALVIAYAPNAPDKVQNEAVIRTVGWLLETPRGSIRSRTERRDVEGAIEDPGRRTSNETRVQYATSEKGALRHSGAMSLLSPWKQRRAGVI